VFAQERRQIILAQLRKDGRVEVAALARRLGVSDETIRRDLTWLEETGQAVRTHGGALLRSLGALPLAERCAVSLEAKQAIGKLAAGLIQPGESVLIDSGSTGLEIARALNARLEVSPAQTPDIHVVTNSLAVAVELANAPHVLVTVLGGTLRSAELCMVGPETVAALKRYRLDRVFLACAGIDLERGIAVANPFEAEVKRAMLAGASQRIVAADGSKLGRTALVQIAGLDGIDLLITDRDADVGTVAALRAAGLQVILPEE
jgi:DeoR/GlpR family transcriptional regulator of sugar metabolism